MEDGDEDWRIKICSVKNHTSNQWLFLVPLKGGRWQITPQKAIYKWYISGIYCQLGDYMLPTTFYMTSSVGKPSVLVR